MKSIRKFFDEYSTQIFLIGLLAAIIIVGITAAIAAYNFLLPYTYTSF